MITAFDPGPHVGVAQYDNGVHNEFELEPDYIWAHGEMIIQGSEVVVCESFTILGSRDKNSNATIEMIGVLRYFARKHNKPFIEQRPADAKFSSNEKLKKLGWWIPSKNDHARSASRHLLLFLVNTRRIDPAQFL